MSKMSLTPTFRITALIEGVSFLVILFITMPLKYLAHIKTPNQYVGMAHGVLFISYVIIAYLWYRDQDNLETKDLWILWLASIIPFGTFWMDKRYLKA